MTKTSPNRSVTRAGRSGGFTLIEFTLVTLILGISMLLIIPGFFRAGTGMSELDKLTLWIEVLHERAAYRGEVFLLEVDPLEHKMRVVQPVVVEDALAALGGEEGRSQSPPSSADEAEGQSELVEVADPYFPASFEFSDAYTLYDIQGPDGEKVSDRLYYVVIYPYGWIDPVVFHLLDDNRDEWTGLINPVTGKIEWIEGYEERIREEGV